MGGIMGLGGIVAEDPERLEEVYPLHVHEMELRTDSGGAGRWRGGLGPTMAVSPVDHEATFTVGGDFGQDNPPRGRSGGTAGGVVRVFKDTPEGRTEYERAWQYIELEPGDVYVQESGGGGGVGDPYERNPSEVASDVQDGYVSRGAAREKYGVVVGSESQEVDEQRTEALRARRR
jgi:N-methylhydantoinase B